MNVFSAITKTPASQQKPIILQKADAFVNAHNPDTLFRSPNCACGGSCPACKKKSKDINISQPWDAAEIEADKIADKVMEMPANNTSPVASRKKTSAAIQRKCDTCEHGEEIIQRKPVSSGAGVPTKSPSHISSAVSSGGHPLDNQTRNFFEPRMGRNFDNVRVHTDSNANQSARAIDAKAYTLGKNIIFGRGEYKPNSENGRHLLAHELAHVMQSGEHSSQIDRNTLFRQPIDKPQTTAKQEAPEITAARKELDNIDAAWDRLKIVAKSSSLAASWIKKGDEVIALIRTHTTGAIDAIGKNDSTLLKQYNAVLETDLIAYQYVSWHAMLYQNIDRIHPWVNNLHSTFGKDDRAFTGRKEAEEIIGVLKQLAQKEKKDSSAWLSKLSTTTFTLQSDSGTGVSVTLTSAADSKKRQLMQDETAKVKELEKSLEMGVNYVNQFLDTAFDEGLEQAGEAIVEFYLTKQSLKKPKAKKKKQTAPNPQPNVGPILAPMPDEEQKKRKKCKDICETPLPIYWPGIMPLPGYQRPLVRTPSNDEYISPDKRSKPQRDLQKEIREQHERHRSGRPGAYVPRPCFANDADPNDLYDAHHIHPLFLGGAEDEINLCALRRDKHERAHPTLNSQKLMFATNATWINCKVCSAYLPDHLALQHYEID